MSDSDEEVLLLALLLILRRRRKRRLLLNSREENFTNNCDTPQSSSGVSPNYLTSRKRKRVSHSSLHNGKKVRTMLNLENCSDDPLENTLAAIKCEPSDADDDGSSSFDRKDIHGVVIKDEPFDDWSGDNDYKNFDVPT